MRRGGRSLVKAGSLKATWWVTGWAAMAGLGLFGFCKLGVTPVGAAAVDEIARWACQPQHGPEGRPLPLVSEWTVQDRPYDEIPRGNAARGWSPDYYIELIRQGFYVLPTFADKHFLAMFDTYRKEGGPPRTDRLEATVEFYRPALEFCRVHRLPLAFIGNNYEDMVRGLAVHKETWQGQPPDFETDPRLIIDGVLRGAVDPLGPEDGWREFARLWFGHHLMRRMQEIYPDPPLVLFYSNNEGGKAGVGHLNERNARFLARYGPGPHDDDMKRRVIDEGYRHLYGVLFQEACDTLIAPAWKANVRFVAYNLNGRDLSVGKSRALWPSAGYPLGRPWDGCLPEYYDNDWQGGKTDYMAESPQVEAMNLAAMQPAIWEVDPNFFWGTIAWEGSYPGDYFRARGPLVGNPSKPNLYVVGRGQDWDFERLEGLYQFGLWMMRPRDFKEFRGYCWRNAWENAAWEVVLRIGQRPWVDPVLREFWQHGRLVPNATEGPRHELAPDQPPWVRRLDRWFLLTCDANPPRQAAPVPREDEAPPAQPIPTIDAVLKYSPEANRWENNTILCVFAMALELGDAPERRWLIYAHAPLGSIGPVTVDLPGFGSAKLDVVTTSGSFFLVTESDRTVAAHHRGDPRHALRIQPAQFFVRPGEPVEFTVETAAPADDRLRHTRWTFGEGWQVRQRTPTTLTRKFRRPGQHLVTARARTESGHEVVGQAAIFVTDDPPPAEVVYDLPLSAAYERSGPWSTKGEDGLGIARYRQLPNGGGFDPPRRQPLAAVVVEGEFVDDPARGPVLELRRAGCVPAGVYLFANTLTTHYSGAVSNRTISLTFQAEDVMPRQVLYADGTDQRGMNLYVSAGRLYAGRWDHAVAGQEQEQWLDGGPVAAGQWVEVSLVLETAATDPSALRLNLYRDGQLVASEPTAALLPSYAPPRLGTAGRRGDGSGRWPPPDTRFHDGAREAEGFSGRLSHFHFRNGKRSELSPTQ